MSLLNYDIALLTDHRYVGSARPGDWYHENILHDDRLLQDALRKQGLSSVRVDWADSNVDWLSFRALVFRTTWDYFERIDEFIPWLERVRKQSRLINPPEAITWNMHKRYMPELKRKGIPIVPTQMIPKGSAPVLNELLETAGWDEAVIKPAVSGAARLTYRLNHSNGAELTEKLGPHIENEDFLIQPFMPDIVATGEDTVMVFNGEVTHAVRKVAKEGDYRVQDDHGGTVHSHSPDKEQVELARKAVEASGFDLAYGRVDMVAGPDGSPLLMELEIIEPELWLRFHPPSAEAFADGIKKMVD